MRFHYLVYPEAEERLKPLHLIQRIKIAEEKEELPYLGNCTLRSDVIDLIGELKEKGFYKTFPEDLWRHNTDCQYILHNLDRYPWKVHREGKIVKESADLEDLSLMTGWASSLLLSPEEIWDYRKFGFDSITAFTGTVGAEVWKLVKGDEDKFERAYTWKSKSPEGREYKNQITGSNHMDLRVYKTDITHDETFDPFGNNVFYRPEISDDRQVLAGYHSVESTMLVAILKYVDQLKLKPSCLEDNAKELIEWTRSLGQRGGGCAEHFGGMSDVRMFLPPFKFDIPILDKNSKTDKRTPYWIGTEGEGAYGTYIGSNNKLVFSYESGERDFNQKKIFTISFQPEEAGHLIKGLMYQSAKGLGRTSARQLMEIIKYRFSNDFTNP